MKRSILRGIVYLVAIGVSLDLYAQRKATAKSEPATRARRVFVTGLRTDRLTPKDLQRWEKLKNIVFSTDQQGNPWNTTLVDLWAQLEASGHTIYLEMIAGENNARSLGGSFQIEQLDPEGLRHIAMIRLYLTNIDRAQVTPAAARPNGFIPFENLKREERYIEVLGHEMAHALWILSDLRRATQVKQTIDQTNELFLQRRGQIDNDPELLQRLQERDVFVEDLEAQAEEVEVVIWQELLQARIARAEASKFKYQNSSASNFTDTLKVSSPSKLSHRERAFIAQQK